MSDAASSRTKPSRSARSVWRSSAAWSSVRSSRTPDSSASSRQRRTRRSRRLEVLRRHALRVELARERRVEAMQRRVQTWPRSIGSGSASIFFGSITRSTSHADEQSAKRSSSVAEKTVFAANGSSTAGLRSAVVAVERAARALEPARPVVRGREGERPFGVVDREPRERAQALALARRRLERPRERRERPAPRRARTSPSSKSDRHVLPERARLARRALVPRRLAHEHEALRGRVQAV